MIDWSINFGHFLTIIVLGSGGIGFVYTMRGRIDALGERLGSAENELRKLVELQVAQGRHDERINAMDARMIAQGQRIDENIARVNRLIDERLRRDN